MGRKLGCFEIKEKSKLPEVDGDSEIQKQERPKDWIFFGYAAFCMFVCPILTQPNDRLHSFVKQVKRGQYYVTQRLSKEDEKR